MSSAAFTPLVLALPSLTPSLAIELLPHGVTVHKIYVQADGKTHDLLIGPENPNDFLSQYHKYHNTIVGRYTNRLPVGTHEVERNGIKSQFIAKGNQIDPKVSLHGGPKGFDDVDWEVVHPSQATLFSDEEKVSIGSIPSTVVFRYTSPDGDQGFPGTLLTEVLVGLLNPGQAGIDSAKGEYHLGSILFVYRAKLLEEGKVTPINLTQHWGFNLEASLQGDESTLNVKNHKLTMKAGHTVELDQSYLSTGNLSAVQGTHHQHSSKPIGEGFPESGYDEFYVFEHSAPTPIPTRFPESELSKTDFIQDLVYSKKTKEEPLVELSSEKSGLKLSFSSNPAAFLEFHEPLAAWLNPATSPSGNDTLLASGELYNNFVKVDVTYKNGDAL
ncbi:hypothetical protein EW145_g5208 [Phellinidium pouzarii]|uniref:Aldose 1-epimerase n=1 Tax=Phellinidium pouzarii TaxID=167371 RepID=A0A4S4L5L7_9AGAM|nr:hypothetical protein EW145_g5208 [Phellinidium pouzarii]